MIDYNKVTENIQNKLKEYIETNGIKALVIGVSGGIDSALCCALARPVCDELNIPLIGRSIPIESNKEDEISRADLVGEAFCTDYYKFDLGDEYNYIIKNMIEDGDDIETKIRKGNIKARLRMMYLYDIAQENKGMVLSTDNWTEYFLGFWTLHGDVGDYGMIQQLWKTEVYAIAEELWWTTKKLNEQHALHACIEATPTDGLGITNSDLDQIDAGNYYEVDFILKTWLTNDEDSFLWDDHLKYEGRPENYEIFLKFRDGLKDHPVVKRYEKTQFKRMNPINIDRFDILGELIDK